MIRLSNTSTQSKIVDFVAKHEGSSIGEIQKYLEKITRPTLSRYIKELKDFNIIKPSGEGRSVKYSLSRDGIKSYPFDLSLYDSPYQTTTPIFFNHTLFESYPKLFTKEEEKIIEKTNALYNSWNKNTEKEYRDIALERCAIEFSWKSSKIEGNTYTLLETENLIKNKQEATGKDRNDAVMILNQKHVFDLMYKTNTFTSISISTLTDIHKLLVKDLAIPHGIRTSNVGITGTQYSPLTIQSQLHESLERLFKFLEEIKDPFEQAVVALASIAYIQPFADGNKRTSRHFANLILYMNKLPPVAWRTVNEIEYKKAMIAFYELGNIEPIKEMWVKHYNETVLTFFNEGQNK